MKKKITLIDGSGFIFRAYHALPPLTRLDGTPVGAVYGFCNMLLKFLNDGVTARTHQRTPHQENPIAVIFDSGRRTFRMDIYPEYKANRAETPEDLIPQFPLFREVCDAFGLPSIEREGFEADDIIATYVTQAKAKGYEVIIVSGDKDLMQLIDERVIMLDPLKNKLIGEAEVVEKFGVPPNRVIDAQSLIGDSSDNVPGVPSIGPKTAAELLQAYGSLDGIYENIEKIKQPKRRETLTKYKAQAYLSKELVTLRHDVPLDLSIEDLRVHKTEGQRLKDFLLAQNFKTLANRIAQNVGSSHNSENASDTVQENGPTRLSYPAMTDAGTLGRWLGDVKNILVIDTETTSLNIYDAELVGIALAKGPGDACYVPLAHETEKLNTQLSFGEEKSPQSVERTQLSFDTVRALLLPILEDSSILKVGHNLKYDLAILKKYDLCFNTYDDTLLMSYALDGARHRHNLDALSQKYFNHTMISYKDVIKSKEKGKNIRTFRDVSILDAANYAGEDADYTFQLYEILRPRLFHEQMSALYYQLDKPLIPVICAMEEEGIFLDAPLLKEYGKDFSRRLDLLEKEIFDTVGHTFNIGSPQQLARVLFEEMNLPHPKKNKTGAYSTESDVLEDLALQGYAIAEKILEWRGLSKLLTTYGAGLIESIQPKTQRVHTSFSLTGTSTGRLSSSDPNVQNIPVKSEDGLKIRAAFRAKEGHLLVGFDYSQIELRLLAHMADIPSLRQAFKDSMDIHTKTAAEIFGVQMEHVNEVERRQAKAINFGIIYGISAFGLAKQLNISRSEAQNHIEAYTKRYPGIQHYMEEAKKHAREWGYVKTLFGRHCFTPHILDKNFNLRQFAERQAINAPLQGTNADMVKRAMMEVFELLQKDHYNSKLLLQIHDELIFEMPVDEVDALTPKINRLMENVITLSVPLVVNTSVGNHWGEI